MTNNMLLVLHSVVTCSNITKLCSFTDLPLSPDSPLLDGAADIDFGFDSGIEAEMDEPHGNAFYRCSVCTVLISFTSC